MVAATKRAATSASPTTSTVDSDDWPGQDVDRTATDGAVTLGVLTGDRQPSVGFADGPLARHVGAVQVHRTADSGGVDVRELVEEAVDGLAGLFGGHAADVVTATG